MLFTSEPLLTFPCRDEGAPASLFSAAKYTSGQTLEDPNRPTFPKSSHAKNAIQAGKYAPHLVPSS